MDISLVLQSLIYLISRLMLYPVMILLIILVVWTIFELGGFVYEGISRKRNLSRMEEGTIRARYLMDENQAEAHDLLNRCNSNRYVREFVQDILRFKKLPDPRLERARIEKLLHDYNTKITKRLEKAGIIARVGPMLGLMGTLIPMGPALLGLVNGDMQTLANNLIIAFGTTVLGLCAGGVGYVIVTIRSRWYDQDMSDIEYLTEILYGN
ncbi:MAG TPA: MotA/TolQ/ExbB proton channel family protein [Methanosarcinales archaeon]|nr:MotA/TolQ/ExbB proton channel family protein [Methanosarcinales archaeon]